MADSGRYRKPTKLRTYGDPIIHKTSGQAKDLNEGYDAFVPLIDSGIYIAAWVKPRFLSTILYTCGEFDEDRAVATVRDFFKLAEHSRPTRRPG